MDSKAFNFLRNKAAQGDAQAQLEVARAYSHGLDAVGVRRNDMMAVKWYGMAAEGGSAEAQYELSHYQLRGLGGLERNVPLADHLIEKAADNGEVRAQYAMGHNYENGKGGKQRNYEKALAYFEASAEGGYVHALFDVGRFYGEGKAVARCPRTAMKWHSEAVANGVPQSMYALGSFYEHGDIDGIEVDLEKAAVMYKAAADRGDPRACLKMGEFYLHGKGVDKDYVASFEFFKRGTSSVDAGDFAQANMGVANHYMLGKAVPVSHKDAAEHYTNAVEAGSVEAMYQLGVLCSLSSELEGGNPVAIKHLERAANDGHKLAALWLGDTYSAGFDDIEKNIPAAVEWYQVAASSVDRDVSGMALYHLGGIMRDELLDKGECSEVDVADLFKRSAEMGNSAGKMEIGFRYLKGLGVDENAVKAAHWLKQAGDEGFDNAKCQMAEMYLGGRGVPQDYDEALELLNDAAENGYRPASERIGELFAAAHAEGGVRGGVSKSRGMGL